ncbi:MAG: hypothetical protein JJU05_15640 [Verrucomicrobia bacterium]|nr:hypothetical protein [Verrucomicrobiota bacterium]MCH8528641.1 hypothetical protein [Kiritimatiellia bacterium]
MIKNTRRLPILFCCLLSLLILPAAHAVHEDIMTGPLITRGPDGKLVYRPFTNRGDKIIDFSYAGYKANEQPIPDVPVVKTLEPLPDSPTPALRREQVFMDPEGLDLDDGSPILATPGGRRAHALDCPVILEAEREGRPVVKMTRRMAVRTWVYCDQCPAESREEYDNPHWIRGGSPVEGREMAYPEGPDSHARIQAALDAIAAMEPDADGIRGALLLKRGTYYVNGTLTLHDGVVLRGEGQGEDGTVLIFNNPRGAGIQGRPAGDSGNQTEEGEAFESRIADAYVPAGSTELTLEDVSGFAVGDEIRVMKRVNDTWIDTLDMRRFGWRAAAYARQLMHFREITQIEGNRIHFRVPLPQSIVAEHGGGSVLGGETWARARQIGVEDLSVVSNYNTLVPGIIRMEPGMIYESDMWDNLSHGISLNWCEDSWVRRVTVMHTSSSSVMLSWSRYITVRDAESINPVSPITGTMRYSFRNNNSQMVLYYNCFAERGRHDFVTGARESGPIAFVNGRTEGALGPSETHHRWSTGVLFDTITMENGTGGLQVVNRGGSGSGHGWSGANGVIWNSYAPYIRVQNPPTPEQNFAIGSLTSNVSGNGFIGTSGDPVESRSLFVQQLVDRTGLQNVLDLGFGGSLEARAVHRPSPGAGRAGAAPVADEDFDDDSEDDF